MNESFDPSVIVFAALAIFVVWKLRSVLGVRVERDVSPDPLQRGPASFPPRALATPAYAEEPIAPAEDPAERWKGLAEPGSRVWEGLEAIAAADPSFTGENFIEGARRAYEMIVGAFARGDRETLRNLLSDAVYNQFVGVIEAREKAGETVETAVVSIDRADIENAGVFGGLGEITMRYDAKLMTARRDRDGTIVEGGLDRTTPAHDRWTFARDPRSQNPNWKLMATEAL